MLRLSEGDRSALGPLYQGLWPRCHSLAARILADSVRADDAAQQALMRLVSQAADYDPSRRVVSWALTLVAWECRTLKRRSGRRREVSPTGMEPASSAPSPEDELVRRALLAEATEALRTLSDIDQQTLELAFDDAPVSARPASGPTFRKRRQRALSRLRAAWSARHDR